MSGTIRQPDRNSWAVPHAGVYQAMVLLVMAFVLAAWGFSADPGYIRLALGVVTGLGVMAVALSSVMAQIWRHGRNDRQSAKAKTPASFMSGRAANSAPLRETSAPRLPQSRSFCRSRPPWSA